VTYNVFGGTLSLTQSINQSCIRAKMNYLCHPQHYVRRHFASGQLDEQISRCNTIREKIPNSGTDYVISASENCWPVAQ